MAGDDDIVTYARDAASRGDDLFKLLDIDATSTESEIRRAFRRKALTAHPDKAGDAYDPALYERLERARDVLTHSAAREAYDNGMRAILQKKQALEQMSSRRRKLVEELELREQAAKKPKVDDVKVYDAEFEAMAARGRAKMEERKRLIREAEERERQAQEKADDEREADLERRLREVERRKAEKRQRKGKKDRAPEPATELPSSQLPPSATTTESKPEADMTSKKSDDTKSAPPTPPSGNTSSSTTASGGFPSLMARLKAAQAKKEEEKRRAAQNEAAA